MTKNAAFLIFLSVLAGLNLGTIRKAEDPIRDTQTSPILYEQKMEEEKDGKKGPLLYHVRNNPREAFFFDPPFVTDKESSGEKIAEKWEPLFTDTMDWWEEQPADPQAPSADESTGEPLPPFWSGEESPESLEATEQPSSAVEAENVPPKGGDDYWW